MERKILFSGKNKKNIINLSSAENAQRVVKVKSKRELSSLIRGDFLGASHGAKHQLQLNSLTMKTNNFKYFRASEWGKMGPYAHTLCNFLNLTEIF